MLPLVSVPEAVLQVALPLEARNLLVCAVEKTAEWRQVSRQHAGLSVVRTTCDEALNCVIVHVEAVDVPVETIGQAVAVVDIGDVYGLVKYARQLRVLAPKFLLQCNQSCRVCEAENHEAKGVLATARRTVVAVQLSRKLHEQVQTMQVSLAKAQHMPAKIVGESVDIAIAVGGIDSAQHCKGGDTKRRCIEGEECSGQRHGIAERAWGQHGLHLHETRNQHPNRGLLMAFQSRHTHVATPVRHLANGLT